MKIGCCTGFDNAAKLAEMGYDYIEYSVNKIAAMNEEEFAKVVELVDSLPIKVEAFNGLFPGSIRLTGPDADLKAATEYIDGVFPRLKRLGGDAVVFGSGGARRVPDGFDRDEAWKQLIAVGKMLGQKAREYGLVIALEPLNKKEVNIINSQLEGKRLVDDVDDPGFKLLSDYYHLALEGEGAAEVEACGSRLVHTHIANPDGRVTLTENDEADYLSFFNALKKCGYTGRISFEGKVADFDAQMPETLKVLRALAGKAGL
jgi:sugar phosphate isomerase/epimerase